MLIFFTKFADLIVWQWIGLERNSHLGKSFHFFIEDTTKIFFLIIIMIYLIALMRATLNIHIIRDKLQGRSKWFGYIVASMFGAITPFCSCSSIPMFLGFTSAGIPTGVTLAFLITSPLINEVAVVLLGSLLGWEFTVVYILAGIFVGVAGGFLFNYLKADEHLQEIGKKARQNTGAAQFQHTQEKMTLKARHDFAKQETIEIINRIWKWIFFGVGVGATLHGFVPESWIAKHLGAGSWWSVPMAVIVGIPLYSNASGMIPVVETLLAKGLPVGTALALMMSTVGASFPEFILLKKVLKTRLLVWLFIFFLIAFTFIGWFINIIF